MLEVLARAGSQLPETARLGEAVTYDAACIVGPIECIASPCPVLTREPSRARVGPLLEGSMERELRKLRTALAGRESGRGRRFSAEIRRRISSVGRRLRDDGTSWSGISAALGLPTATVRRLCDSDARGFARVEVVADPVTAGGLVVVTPSGFRIEGLDANGAATLIRQLA